MDKNEMVQKLIEYKRWHKKWMLKFVFSVAPFFIISFASLFLAMLKISQLTQRSEAVMVVGLVSGFLFFTPIFKLMTYLLDLKDEREKNLPKRE
jgi:uncharacterized membrane protein YjjP (DUF1212 family)